MPCDMIPLLYIAAGLTIVEVSGARRPASLSTLCHAHRGSAGPSHFLRSRGTKTPLCIR